MKQNSNGLSYIRILYYCFFFSSYFLFSRINFRQTLVIVNVDKLLHGIVIEFNFLSVKTGMETSIN